MRWLVLFAFSFVCCSCQKEQEPEVVRPVMVLTAEKEPIEKVRSYPGRTRAVNRANLSFRVSGPLIERPVYVGDAVEEGDLLARIDPTDFEVRLDNVRGQLEKSEAELRFAENDYKRAERIQESDPGAISQSLVDRKLEDWNRLKGEGKALQAEVDAAKNALSYTYLLAPYDSTITATFVENYEYVEAKQPIIRILDNSQIEMVIDVPETFIGEIPKIAKITVSFDTLPGKVYPATLKEIGSEATVTTRTYPVTLMITQDEGEEKIIAGMAGDAYLYRKGDLGTTSTAFILPTTAIFSDEGTRETFVWIVDPTTSTVHKQPIRIGEMTTRGIIVEEGLAPHDLVVQVGVHSLREGQHVVPLTDEDIQKL